MNVSSRFSELKMYIYQCYFCQNSEAFEALLQMIGDRIWTEAEHLLVDLLQQAMQNFLSAAFQKCSANEILHAGQCK